MEQIKPKKERKFLKAMGEVALTLVRELLLNVGKKLINKSGNKRQSLVLAFIILASTFAIAQYPTTTNKQRLGFQTSGDGLVFRGRASDTTALKPSTINNAYHLFDTLNNALFSYIKTKGGWKFNNSDTVIIQGVTMPFDSITFNTAKDGTVGVGEVEYNDTQGSLIQGLKGGLVTNVIGQQLHQRVNNRTGATLTKGTAVYLSGSQGNRITVAKALGVTDAFSANTFGIVAENILHNQSGYVITEGLIKDINTSALVEDSAVYLSPTVAGGLTSTKPQAPQHTVYIGVCVKSNAGSGELFVKIRNGQELDELHDVRISSPIEKSSLYYSGGLWRDTTAALLVSDTASMLTRYFRDADTFLLNLTSRFAAKLNISDTASMLTNYARKGTGGTVTSVSSGSTSISVSTPTTTPIITIADASIATSGVMTTNSQGFIGDKQFYSPVTFWDIAFFKNYSYQATRLAGLSTTDRLSIVTLGSGLSLSAGVLSATSGGVTSVTASIPLSSSGGATPNITITDASIGASGVVNTTTQSFAGNKTFNGTVTLASATGTATSVIGRSSTGQVVGVTLGTGLSLASGTLTPSTGDGIITTNGYIGLDKKSSITVGTDFPSTSAQSSSDLTFSLTGVSVGQPVLLGVPDGSAPANTNYTAWVSATNTVKIRFNNYSASTVNPASGSFTITVLNL